MLTYPFTADEFKAAYAAWGCNCGPAALAFALQTKLDKVREAIPDFESRRYTSPMMMAAALQYFGERYVPVRPLSRNRRHGLDAMFAGPVSLVRIQWTGPWTAKAASAKWAATHTHWIVCWVDNNQPRVFDCNRGVVDLADWEKYVVTAILETIPRADGDWYPADVWQLPGVEI